MCPKMAIVDKVLLGGFRHVRTSFELVLTSAIQPEFVSTVALTFGL